MSVNKFIEIYCNYCGQAEHFHVGSIEKANKLYKEGGGIVKSNGSHYCTPKCYEQGYFGSKEDASK